jgi:serine/threonine protein kinase
LASHAFLDEVRFAPGSPIAERYRIVSLLGRGSMGEVFRADDLTLGQPVALKFLPESMIDESMLERFRNEVRIARRISHPNVCRVYDIGEIDNQLFLSMEYVDGEDLSSRLRRIVRRYPRGSDFIIHCATEVMSWSVHRVGSMAILSAASPDIFAPSPLLRSGQA